jgi:hypothetical protein
MGHVCSADPFVVLCLCNSKFGRQTGLVGVVGGEHDTFVLTTAVAEFIGFEEPSNCRAIIGCIGALIFREYVSQIVPEVTGRSVSCARNEIVLTGGIPIGHNLQGNSWA